MIDPTETLASGREVRHLKSGNTYVVVAEALDVTNDRSGNVVVIYHRKGDSHGLFARDKDEFCMKFELEDNMNK